MRTSDLKPRDEFTLEGQRYEVTRISHHNYSSVVWVIRLEDAARRKLVLPFEQEVRHASDSSVEV